MTLYFASEFVIGFQLSGRNRRFRLATAMVPSTMQVWVRYTSGFSARTGCGRWNRNLRVRVRVHGRISYCKILVVGDRGELLLDAPGLMPGLAAWLLLGITGWKVGSGGISEGNLRTVKLVNVE